MIKCNLCELKHPINVNVGNMVFFSLNLYTLYDDFQNIRPGDLESEIVPKCELKNRFWIPQTIAESVWVWYEFQNIEDKKEYIEQLNDKYRILLRKEDPLPVDVMHYADRELWDNYREVKALRMEGGGK